MRRHFKPPIVDQTNDTPIYAPPSPTQCSRAELLRAHRLIDRHSPIKSQTQRIADSPAMDQDHERAQGCIPDNFSNGCNGSLPGVNGTDGKSTSAEFARHLHIVIACLYLLMWVTGVIGNIVVIFILLKYTKMKTATNIYIFNLALADALVTSPLPFQSAKLLLTSWPFGRMLCKIIIAIDYYNMFTSIFTVTAMSVDRYIAVCHPIRAMHYRTAAKAKLINVAIWIASSAIGLPVMVLADTKEFNGSIACIVNFPSPVVDSKKILNTCVFIFAFMGPVCVITACYGCMLSRLRSVRLLSGSREKDRSMRRITRLVLTVVAVFIICWTPIQMFVLIETLVGVPNSSAVFTIRYICITLGYANSCLNPALYAFLDESFRHHFYKLFCTASKCSGNMPQRLHLGLSSGVGVGVASVAQKETSTVFQDTEHRHVS
uniref:Opioid receptor, delta 1a n=1 Tax=Eptatretus burgeri TaxID=7764 RepID=A0A8C4NC08_EPTBU